MGRLRESKQGCFPTVSLIVENKRYIYYGASDERIAVTPISLSDLLKELMLYASIIPT